MKKWIMLAAAVLLMAAVLSGCRFGNNVTEENADSGYHEGTEENKEEETMNVIHVNKENFQEVVLNSDKTVLLDFWASWCGPCRMVSPILDEIAQEREDVLICKVNVDEEMELASQFGVVSIPLLVVMEDGKIVNQSVGAKPKEAILAMIDG